MKDLGKALTAITRSAVAIAVATSAVTLTLDAMVVDESIAEDLDILHIQAELARKRGDRAGARRLLGRALELAVAGLGTAGGVGNCAIEAEASDFNDYAKSFYEIALQRDAQHVNNRQCYVSFLLDAFSGDAESIRKAGRLLDDLEMVDQRRERTRALRAQYLSLLAKDDAGYSTQLDGSVRELQQIEFTSIEQAKPALSALLQMGRVDDFRKMVEVLRKKFPASSEDLMILDRILADKLASDPDDDRAEEAIAIYRNLIARGNGNYDVMHNLATVLFSRTRRDVSGEVLTLWTTAYAMAPHDSHIRKALAQYLMRHGREKDAEVVLAGRPLSPQVLGDARHGGTSAVDGTASTVHGKSQSTSPDTSEGKKPRQTPKTKRRKPVL